MLAVAVSKSISFAKMFGPKAHVHYVTKKCKLIIRTLDRVLKRCYTRIFNVCFRAGSAVGELYLDDGESVNLRNVHTKLSYQLAPGILTRNKIIKSDSVTRYYTYRLLKSFIPSCLLIPI